MPLAPRSHYATTPHPAHRSSSEATFTWSNTEVRSLKRQGNGQAQDRHQVRQHDGALDLVDVALREACSVRENDLGDVAFLSELPKAPAQQLPCAGRAIQRASSA